MTVWSPTLARTARTLAATTVAGLAVGFAVGGVGGRLAMRALFLTSDPAVRGVTSDDGFAIGRFDLVATLNLVALGTLIGVIGAFVYLAVRPFLIGPRWFQITTCALGAGAVVGSMLVHTDGVDFTLLGPRWFAIALFVALPALFGALAAPAVEWATRDDGWFQTASPRLALLPLVVLVIPPLFLIPVVAGLVVAVRGLAQRAPALADLARHPATLWSARAVWLAVAVAGLGSLVRDAARLL